MCKQHSHPLSRFPNDGLLEWTQPCGSSSLTRGQFVHQSVASHGSVGSVLDRAAYDPALRILARGVARMASNGGWRQHPTSCRTNLWPRCIETSRGGADEDGYANCIPICRSSVDPALLHFLIIALGALQVLMGQCACMGGTAYA